MELNRWALEQRLKGYAGMALGGLMFVAGVWVWLFQDRQEAAAAVIFAGGLFFLLGFLATRIAGLGAWLFKTDKRPYSLEFIPERGIKATIASEQNEAPWSAFGPFYETPRLIVLPFRSRADALMVPKRCCEEGQLAELRSLLTRQLNEPSLQA
jgi:hypothetical protein